MNGSNTGSNRVIRGGSSGNNADRCRSAARYCNSPEARHNDVGFRVVRTSNTLPSNPFTLDKHSKFSVGDRVAVYDNGMRYTGTITKIEGRMVNVKCVFLDAELLVLHKQCRRLIKKKREEIWIYPDYLINYPLEGAPQPSITPIQFWIKFRRVKDE